MNERRAIAVEGNEGAASVAYRASEVIAIYPITPSSTMAELSDEWRVKSKKNIWGDVPDVVQMQSEAGAAGAAHGALQAGALATSFTASQGLLLFIPNMFKIAGELNAFVLHVAARAVATSALSIFGDHSDVMSCRQTGFAMLASSSVQEAHDLACVAHAATLDSRVPFLHFFDGFRTSHELNTLEALSDDMLRQMIDDGGILAHRKRALSPDHPFIRGTAANPDTYFQMREVSNRFYQACPGIVQEKMDRFASLTDRSYHLFDYYGDPDAERVIVAMGSGAEVAKETADWLRRRGEKVGVVQVRLYRPFAAEAFLSALPATTRVIGVLDRTKEPGSLGEPLYQDVLAAFNEARGGDGTADAWPPEKRPRVVGGRYGIGSKEFDPAMAKGVFDGLAAERPKNHFTIGIDDDLTGTSLDYDAAFDLEPDDVVRAVFFGLGADGTVGANKNSIKIIAEDTPNYAQGYFVYDSKKSGGVTVSHLRFGPRPINSSYLVKKAGFVACHQYRLLDKQDVLGYAGPGAIFLLNTPFPPDEVWDSLTEVVQRQILDKQLQLWVIDAFGVARDLKLGFRINTIMQTCFFAISGVLPRDEAIAKIKASIEKTYGKKGGEVVKRNFAAVDHTLEALHQVDLSGLVAGNRRAPSVDLSGQPAFVQDVTARMMAGLGEGLPVSAMPEDGAFPSGTTRFEKRNIALEIPIWDPDVCIQCGRCAFVCPHASIRTKLYSAEDVESTLGSGYEGAALYAPPSFKHAEARGRFKGRRYTVQVAPEDCTGCRLCVTVCPGKDKANPSHKAINMESHADHVEAERENYGFFLDLPNLTAGLLEQEGVGLDVKTSQLCEPLFEYSGACAGCGETQYLKLLTQLFGDRLLVANATGCSSIYGGNQPTTPWAADRSGRGPAWSNSLFEDAAEFGLGFRLAVDKQRDMARRSLLSLRDELPEALMDQILGEGQAAPAGIDRQRRAVAQLKALLGAIDRPEARRLESLADFLVDKSVWSVGGDGWAYDIGFGGLDHVLYLGRKTRLLVLDTEVYSNTGGQVSKSSPMGAVAKFAADGNQRGKKDLGMMAMTYGTAYVAQVAWGADENQTVKAFLEAESFPGASLIIGYAHCIGHGYDLAFGMDQQRLAVQSGRFPLYRFDPRRRERGENPLVLDSKPPSVPLQEYLDKELRFRQLEQLEPDRARSLFGRAQTDAKSHYRLYQKLSEMPVGEPTSGPPTSGPPASGPGPAGGPGPADAAPDQDQSTKPAAR